MPLYTTDYCNGHSGHVVWEEQSLKEGFVCYSLWEDDNQTSLQAKWDGLLSLFWSVGFQQWLFSQASAEHWMLYALKYVRVQHSWLWWSRKLTWFLQGEMSAATEGAPYPETALLGWLPPALQSKASLELGCRTNTAVLPGCDGWALLSDGLVMVWEVASAGDHARQAAQHEVWKTHHSVNEQYGFL